MVFKPASLTPLVGLTLHPDQDRGHRIGVKTMALTLKHALECIEMGSAKARELGFLVAIAVVDEAGHLVACHRMDGALWVAPEIARAKANAAAAFRASTDDLENRFTGARQLFASNVAALEGFQFVFGKGAVPLVEDGKIIGAVGVSGAVPAENDHDIAGAAAGHPVVPKSH
jgi:uncharacterized protein GlcG (DUF336 family)